MEGMIVEDGIVAEAVLALGFEGDGPVNFAPESPDDAPPRGEGHDADEPGPSFLAWNAFEPLQDLADVLCVRGSRSREACGIDAGFASESIDRSHGGP